MMTLLPIYIPRAPVVQAGDAFGKGIMCARQHTYTRNSRRTLVIKVNTFSADVELNLVRSAICLPHGAADGTMNFNHDWPS